jgi:uncharacterized protein YndB with AHSA1/START domain
MQSLHSHTPVDGTFFAVAPLCITVRRELPVSADELFRRFEDPEFWRRWIVDRVEWTSPAPLGRGATRNVWVGPLQAEEHFFAWDPGRRIAFTFARSTIGLLESFAEDYRLTDLGDGRCELEWTMAFSTRGRIRGAGLIKKALTLANGAVLARIDRALKD